MENKGLSDQKTAVVQYLTSRPEAVEDYPFGPEAQVFKILGKMFALLSYRNGQNYLNLKCDPLEAVQLRDVFEAVQPGYHMNKKHWNTVILDGSVPESEIERMIGNSYTLVVKSLKKGERLGLEARHGSENVYS
ncbi:MAG: MmcQ/YjbR family DNA-binding protein [Oceanobacter sp.]